MNYTKTGPFVANAAPAYDSPAWLNGVETALYSIRPQVSHVVAQQGSNTIAIRMTDGTVLSSLATSAANNVTVINAAINDAAASQAAGWVGGGVVFLSRGLYSISSSIVLKYGVSLCGPVSSWHDDWSSPGLFGASLQPTAGMTAGTAVIQAGVTATTTRVATNPHGSRITDLVIDCSLNANNVDGIVWQDCSYTRTEDVYVTSARYGVAYRGNVAQSGGPTTGSSLDNQMRNCAIKACTYGVYCPDSASTDGEIVNCRLMSSTTAQIYIRSGGWQVLGGHFTVGGAARHIDVVATPFTCTGAYLDSGSTYLAVIQSTAATFVGNHVTPGTSTANAAIQLPWGKVNCSGNDLYVQSGTSSLRGFFEVPAGTSEGLVANNTVRNKGTGFVSTLVNGSGVAIGATSTATMFVGNNAVWTS